MSIGTWSPEGEENKSDLHIEAAWLKKFIDFSRSEQLENINKLIAPKDQETLAGLMLIPHNDWFAAVESLSEDEITHLIRFFTVAEMKLINWEAKDRSPVIWLCKTLKKRGKPIDKALLKWIRANSNNRFLPHGSI